ncbi:MAG TPA: peptidase S10 [Terriglobales bacterium]|nr:peptidase S10 [Terriglobales bacterium]
MKTILLAALAVILTCSVAAQQPESPREQAHNPKPSTQQKPTEAPPESQPPQAPNREREQQEQQHREPSAASSSEAERSAQAAAANYHWDMAETTPVQSHHQITVNGRTLHYTATAGRLPIKDPTGKIDAEMFFVAYTLDGTDPARRPLTFSYNGGPGSASIWLHMGALGPRTVVLQPEGWMPEAPYRLHDNPDTPLDVTDIVMIDAIGTGYSRPADMEQAHKFWGLQGDIESFGEFIRMYVSRYERWSSPLYLLGESYGTTRSAGVAGYLADRGINFNGICLLSMVLNFESLEFAPINDVPYPLILPTMAMIAGYHHKLPPNLEQDMNRTRQQVSDFAMNQYWQALNKGDALTAEERANLADKVSEYTGLPKNVVQMANMRIDVRTFMQWLLADQQKVVGRLDGRYTSPAPKGALENERFDPTSAAIQGPFTAVFNDYIRRDLNYKVDMPYYTSAGMLGPGVFKWKWENPQRNLPGGDFEMGYADVASALRSAMIKNPYLRILVMEGDYDMATPFLAAQYTMDHLNVTPDVHKNISYAYYASGHMVYLDSKAHDKMHKDYADFVNSAMPQQ